MKRLLMFGLALFMSAILLGCTPMIKTMSDPFPGQIISVDNSSKENVFISIDSPPVMTAGIPLLDYTDGQEFAMACPTYLVNKEYRLLRKSWLAIGVDSDGNFYPGVVLLDLKRKDATGNFWCSGKVFAPKRSGINVFIPSTRGVMGFGKENGFVIDKTQLTIAEYRKSLFAKGTPLQSLPNSKAFDGMIAEWNGFHTPFGNILTPYSQEVVVGLSKAFTGYTKKDRYQRDAKETVGLPIGMIVSRARDVYLTAWGPTSGWDMDSQDENRELTQAFLLEAQAKAKTTNY